MALFSKSELCTLFKVPSNQFSVMLKRAVEKGIVAMTGNMIDDNNPSNNAWILKYSQKALQKKGSSPEIKQEKDLKIIHVSARDRNDKQESSPQETGSWDDLNRKKMIKQIEKLENENKKLKLSNERTVGSFLSVEHTIFIVTNLSENLSLSWENEIKNFVDEVGAKYQLTRDEIVAYQKNIISRSNIAKDRAFKDTKKNIRKFQNEASDMKGIGEHD